MFNVSGSVCISKKTREEDWKPIFEDHNIVVNHSAWIISHLLRGSTGSEEDSTVSSSNFNIRKIWLGNRTPNPETLFPPEYVYHGSYDTTFTWSREIGLASVAKGSLGNQSVKVCNVIRGENNKINFADLAMNTVQNSTLEVALLFTMIVDYSETTGFNNGATTYNVIALTTNEAISIPNKTPHVFAIRNLGDTTISKLTTEALKIEWAIIFTGNTDTIGG